MILTLFFLFCSVNMATSGCKCDTVCHLVEHDGLVGIVIELTDLHDQLLCYCHSTWMNI